MLRVRWLGFSVAKQLTTSSPPGRGRGGFGQFSRIGADLDTGARIVKTDERGSELDERGSEPDKRSSELDERGF